MSLPVIVMLNVGTVLEAYGTFQECQTDRNRVGYEMARPIRVGAIS